MEATLERTGEQQPGSRSLSLGSSSPCPLFLYPACAIFTEIRTQGELGLAPLGPESMQVPENDAVFDGELGSIPVPPGAPVPLFEGVVHFVTVTSEQCLRGT